MIDISSPVFYPVLWLIIIVLVMGVFSVTSSLKGYFSKIGLNPELLVHCRRQVRILRRASWVLWTLLLSIIALLITSRNWDLSVADRAVAVKRAQLAPVYNKTKFWVAPDHYLAETDTESSLISYGRDLVANTQDYYGPEGLVRPASINGMNCQNCHLEAGSKPFGNNYFAVASTYPQIRGRSGQLETIPKRVNDCFQRSLNGQPLDTTSREMQAFVAYLRWLGTGVPKGEKPKGTGLVELPFLDRAAEPMRGQKIFLEKCASCHGSDGQGLPMPESPRFYPPLWGDQSYNEAAGLFRLSRFAGYVQANMPFGASYDNPQLTAEEAWDLAAYVNSQPRPKHPFLGADWPKIEKKPYDHPFGPYVDSFPESQHKYGPFGPIVAFYKSRTK